MSGMIEIDVVAKGTIQIHTSFVNMNPCFSKNFKMNYLDLQQFMGSIPSFWTKRYVRSTKSEKLSKSMISCQYDKPWFTLIPKEPLATVVVDRHK